jgi:hypothetical protein
MNYARLTGMEVRTMPRIIVDLSTEEIKNMVFQLPAQEFLVLVDTIEERAEAIAMMRLSETGFQEWNEDGEDIYDAKA